MKKSIYSKKQNWKIVLAASALLIVFASVWYTNILADKIAREEKQKVKLWAQATERKANLVRYTNELFNRLKNEERKKVELWAEATRRLVSSSENSDFTFVLKVVTENNSVPVILADEKGNVISYRNLDSTRTDESGYIKEQMALMKSMQEPIEIRISEHKTNYLYYKDSRLFSELKQVLDDLIKSFISEVVENSASVPVIFTDSTRSNVIAYGNVKEKEVSSAAALQRTLEDMESSNPPITIEIGNGQKNYIFYKESYLLRQLKYYPFIQFGVIGLFLLIAYTLFSTARKAEQNQVWIGMAKETAHQLGTPLSSLIAWVEVLKEKGMYEEAHEVEKDVRRLETITERFSKIGSLPVLKKENLAMVLEESINYLKSRTPSRIIYTLEVDRDIMVPINVPLFEWVIENLVRNAVDAMEAEGEIRIKANDQQQFVYLDITDTGKGITRNKFRTVFQPGFTTKRRGWGLGLSLAKRIIENYHEGKIFVKSSEQGKGTTFRIVLNKKMM